MLLDTIFNFSIFAHSETWVSLLTLTFLEIVLGIDNIIFISIVAGKLPASQQGRARSIGLMLALLFRIIMLLGITWILQLTNPLFTMPIINKPFTIKSLILLLGGLFLIAKSTSEIHGKLEGEEQNRDSKAKSFLSTILMIVAVDIVFSFDSILTAVGLVSADKVLVMILAVILSMIVMLVFSGPISNFINKRPTIQMLALSFLILIGFMLCIDALGYHVEKSYIYFAMFFSLIVEFLNLRLRKKSSPVNLRDNTEEFMRIQKEKEEIKK